MIDLNPQNIKKILKMSRNTIDRLAEQMGYSRIHVYRIMRGEQKPSVRFYQIAARAIKEILEEDVKTLSGILGQL